MNGKSYKAHTHFSADRGWINDPNGLVLHDGIFELYYQYNPKGIEWNHISWGHARSTDLTHWEELPVALGPDETGYMFSGCGIVNERGLMGLPEDALIFFYTAAGHMSPESAGRGFAIMSAYSLDGGRTLVKTGRTVLRSVGWESRDPAVFWHEESGAYILVLYLEDHDFGIYRSEDLESFQLSQRITLEYGFECPDLFCLPVYDTEGKPTQEERWVFWTGDGSYFVGDFDGYRFRASGTRELAYAGTGRVRPYAAQTWSGVPDGRVISEAWLTSDCVGNVSTGAMCYPRELSLVRGCFPVDGRPEPTERELLRMVLPDEIAGQFRSVGRLSAGEELFFEDAAVQLHCAFAGGFEIAFLSEDKESLLRLEYRSARGNLLLSAGEVSRILHIGADVRELTVQYDRGILEISGRDGRYLHITDYPEFRSVPCRGVRMLCGEGAAADVSVIAGQDSASDVTGK